MEWKYTDNKEFRAKITGELERYSFSEKKYKQAPIYTVTVKNKNGNNKYLYTRDRKNLVLVSRIMATLFVPNDDKNKDRVSYKDENTLNVSVDNLFWYNHSDKNLSRCFICLKPLFEDKKLCLSCAEKFEVDRENDEQVKALKQKRKEHSEKVNKEWFDNLSKSKLNKKIEKRKKEMAGVPKYLLTNKEKEILNMYLNGKTYQEIGDKYNCTRQNIYQTIDKIKSK